jgi:hypothetical protein
VNSISRKVTSMHRSPVDHFIRPAIGAMLALVTLGLLACDRAPQEGGARDTVRSDTPRIRTLSQPRSLEERVPEADTTERPSTRTDTMMIEGEPEPFEARRVDAALYTTYYPADEMLLEQGASDEGEGVRFIANFGGTRNDSAFLHIFTPGDATAGPDAMRRLLLDQTGILRSNDWGWTAEESSAERCPWALESYAIKGPARSRIVGFACIGEHRGRGLVVVAAYPDEYADGMGPRVASILDALEWKDTKTGLRREEVMTRPLE